MDNKKTPKKPQKIMNFDLNENSIIHKKNNASICDDKTKWITLDNSKIENQKFKYSCRECGFNTKNLRDFNRHKKTKKHKKKTQLGSMVTNEKKFFCPCGKLYKYNSGLSKHKKTCQFFLEIKNGKKMENMENMEKMEDIIISNHSDSENQILKELLEQNKTLIDKLTTMANEPKIVNYQNCNNKKMTVNVYLNEKCKDAMNLSDFMQKLRITLDDLTYTKQKGYVEGISNIFVKHLADLNPTERPIHCSDKKRLQFYVKDENRWEKDQKNRKLEKTIHDVSIKQIQQVGKWEKENPNFENDDRLLNEWQETVHAVMGGGDDKLRKKRRELILKSISSNTEIKEEGLVLTDVANKDDL